MKRDLLVGVAQWLAAPGEPRQNMSVALGMMDDAASRGVELLLLPELWSCGYDPETLARDARNSGRSAGSTATIGAAMPFIQPSLPTCRRRRFNSPRAGRNIRRVGL